MLWSRKLLRLQAHAAGVACPKASLSNRLSRWYQLQQCQQRCVHTPAAFVSRLSSQEKSEAASNDQQQDSEDESSPYPPVSEQSSSSQHLQDSKPNRPNSSPPPDPEPPKGPNLTPQLQYLLLLLTEFGGTYGTAAVAIAWFTHVDPFGGLHWDLSNILFGLQVFVPLILLDAALMLPDYSLDPEDSQAVSGLIFGDPEAIKVLAGIPRDPAEQQDGDNSKSSSSSSPSSTESILLRLQMSLELLQQVYTKANPGIGLNPVNEFLVVCVASLADEMLYRAVGLTLLGLWIRDRLYEAGFDETVSLGPLSNFFQLPADVATSEFARYAAVAVVAALGAAGFAAGALREVEKIKRMQVLGKDGESSEASEALKAQLVASLGSQNIVMYAVEGLREVTASVMAGVAFVATGNLAAPLAGSVVVQVLFSAYQRLSLDRARKKRKAMLKKMKERSNKLQAAMEAAVAAKQAAATTAESTTDDAMTADDADASSSSVSSPVVDKQTSTSQEDDVDLLTAVLREAEKQQKQQNQLQHQQQQQPQVDVVTQHNSTAADSSSTAERRSSSNTSSHEQGVGTSSSSSNALPPDAAQQRLSVLLEDMLRSPEGSRVVQRWMADQKLTTAEDSSSSNSSSSIGSGITGTDVDPQKAIEQLLADPEIKARLLKELEEQLYVLSELQQRRARQEETWRR